MKIQIYLNPGAPRHLDGPRRAARLLRHRHRAHLAPHVRIFRFGAKIRIQIFSRAELMMRRDECEALCSRVVIVRRGHLVALGTTQAIKSKYGSSRAGNIFGFEFGGKCIDAQVRQQVQVLADDR